MNKLVVFVVVMLWAQLGWAQYDKTPNLKANGDIQVPNADIVERTHVKERFPIQYPYVRESDLMWQKRIWRDIDLVQKANHPFYFPVEPKHGRASFASVVFDSIKAGNLIAYSPNDPMRFQLPMYANEFEDMLFQIDTVPSVIQTAEGQKTVYLPDTSELYPSDIKRLRVMEDWYFDKQRSMFEFRIIGIGFLAENRKKGGFEQKFWIYYPHARRVLSRAENIVHGGNRAQMFSYTTMFEKRRFDGLIVKVDNVYDRYITEFAQQQEALYEAERLKQEIINFEQNLWEY
jgi:gliding motility associated protien GldN